MAKRDEFDETAERLLPCERFGTTTCDTMSELECISCRRRPAVAAELRKQAFVNDAVYQGMVKEADDLRCEVERLNKWADGFSDAHLKERALCEAVIKEKDAEITTLKAEAEKRGMERTLAIANRFRPYQWAKTVQEAIRAEIEKAKP